MATRPSTRADRKLTSSAVPERWEFWRDGAHDGVHNMAADTALLRRTSPEGRDSTLDAALTPLGVWRCYQWSTPTVSFGRNEATRGRFTDASLAAAGLSAVRRPTGGRALLHDRELTYSVTFRLPPTVAWRTAYDAVNALLCDALRTMGVDARVAAAEPVPLRPDGPLCFDGKGAGEITVLGAKLAGSAVWREGAGYLQHGSILLHDDQSRLARASAGTMAAPPPAATLGALLPALSDNELVSTFERRLHAVLEAHGPVTPFTSEASMGAAIALADGELRQPGWLWRR